MKNNHNFRSYLLGVLTTLMVLSLATPALAAATQKTIQVSSGVRIYIDDVELRPTDSSGNSVEVFVYNGTTYLPVRAIGEGFGKAVQWDGSTQSVYIGKHSSSEPTAWLANLDYFSGTKSIKTAATEQDNAGQSHYNCITRPFERSYKINGQYTRITGSVYQSYEERSTTVKKDSGIEIYGDGRLLFANILADDIQGFEPIIFDIDITGVLELRVVFTSKAYHNNAHPVLSLGDVALWN